MNTCPQCNRKLISHISPRCNWCGHEIADPAYQAQAEVDRAAFFAQQALHEAQSLAFMEGTMLPGLRGNAAQIAGMTPFPQRRPRGMSEEAFARAAAAQALAQQADQRAAFEQVQAQQEYQAQQKAAYDWAAAEAAQISRSRSSNVYDPYPPTFGTEVNTNTNQRQYQNTPYGSQQASDPYAQSAADPYAEPEQEQHPPQPANRFSALEL